MSGAGNALSALLFLGTGSQLRVVPGSAAYGGLLGTVMSCSLQQVSAVEEPVDTGQCPAIGIGAREQVNNDWDFRHRERMPIRAAGNMRIPTLNSLSLRHSRLDPDSEYSHTSETNYHQ